MMYRISDLKITHAGYNKFKKYTELRNFLKNISKLNGANYKYNEE